MLGRDVVDVGRLRLELASRHPSLHLVDGADAKLRGSFVLEHEGVELDRFAVEVDLSPVHDGQLPIVKEIGGRIPWVEERHINSDGSACVCLPEDYYFTHPGPFDPLTFLDAAVRGFFLGQALVERGEPWPYGEWKHGTAGISEWVDQFFRTMPTERRQAYGRLLHGKKLKGHAWCPCGSGKRVRSCHYRLIERLRLLCSPPTRSAQRASCAASTKPSRCSTLAHALMRS